MPSAFSQTLRALHRDRLHRLATAGFAVLGMGLLAGWSAWFFFAEVPIQAASTQARLESTGHPRQLSAPFDGVVVRVAVGLGQAVQAGDLLIQLDDTDAVLALAAETSRCESIREQARAANAAVSVQEAARAAAASSGDAAVQGALRSASAADEVAKLATQDADRAARLGIEGTAPEAEVAARVGEARQRQAEAQARAWIVEHQRGSASATSLDRQVDVVVSQGHAAAQAADLRACEARRDTLDGAVGRHRILAPSDGIVGALAMLAQGMRVSKGAPVASVVPVDTLHAVATFPLVVAGRITPGAEGRMRLDGFPWSQFGMVPVRVTAVASEPDASGLRIELELDPTAAPSQIPLAHGLPGVVEVDLERLSPAALALRAAGQRLLPSPE